MIWDIINTYRQAFRMYVRRRTRPIPIEEAEEKTLFWSKMYVCVGILLLATATGNIYYSGKNFSFREDIPKDKAILELLVTSEKPVKVVRFQGLTKVEEFDFDPSTGKTNTKVEKLDSTAES